MPYADKPPTKELTQMPIKIASLPDVKLHAKKKKDSQTPTASKPADLSLDLTTSLNHMEPPHTLSRRRSDHDQ